jgi:hypothetical protein
MNCLSASFLRAAFIRGSTLRFNKTCMGSLSVQWGNPSGVFHEGDRQDKNAYKVDRANPGSRKKGAIHGSTKHEPPKERR